MIFAGFGWIVDMTLICIELPTIFTEDATNRTIYISFHYKHETTIFLTIFTLIIGMSAMFMYIATKASQ